MAPFAILLAIFGSVLAGSVPSPHGYICPDVSPCECQVFSSGLDIYCSVDKVTNASILQEIFSRPFPNNTVYRFTLDDVNFSLPANIFGDKQVQNILLFCPISPQVPLEPIDALAFEGQSTDKLEIRYCDMTLTNFQFLASFAKLSKLDIQHSVVGDMGTFPRLETMTGLYFDNTPIKKWFSPENTPSLQVLVLHQVGRHDVLKIIDILDVYQDLFWLDLTGNELDFVPAQIKSLPKLVYLDFDKNTIETLPYGALHISSGPNTLSFVDTPLTTIEVGAFQGNLSSTSLLLIRTRLTTFDEAVFRPLLEMMEGHSGSIDIREIRTFQCGCDMAWLIRDRPSFLDDLSYGACSNGTWFWQLSPAGYADCP